PEPGPGAVPADEQRRQVDVEDDGRGTREQRQQVAEDAEAHGRLIQLAQRAARLLGPVAQTDGAAALQERREGGGGHRENGQQRQSPQQQALRYRRSHSGPSSRSQARRSRRSTRSISPSSVSWS